MNRIAIAFLIAVVGLMAESAGAQSGIFLLDDVPPQHVVPVPPSLGQQPFPAEKEPDLTPSESNSNQLNQLFNFETTPDTCAAGEGYATVDINFLKFPGTLKEFRYQLQGQYAFTDQFALGAYVPVLTVKTSAAHTGMGDVGIYAQYKLDMFVNPQIVDVTAQVDMILPTGDRTALRDTGKFGVRPSLLVYKDFGQYGPGVLGVYGMFGFTITTNSDLRLGVAATYQVNALAGVLELYDVTGKGAPQLLITPGLSYRGLGPWEISAGVPLGVTSGTPDWGIIFKLTYVFAN